MSYDYSENILVQESAGNLLQNELGWDVKFAYNTEVLGKNGTFGRESYRDILLTRYFRDALKKLNPWITENQMDEAQKALEHRLSTSSLLQINEEKYFLIREGIPVTVKKPNGQTETKKAAVLDFQNPDNNYFLAIKELKIHGDLYRRRTDIVGFVNGIPLLFVELKKNTVDVQNAYDDNYTDYQDTIPHLFYYNAFLMLSNGTEAKVGTLGSKYEFFHEWKRLAEEDQGSVALETMLRGICRKENFLDLFENFILYDHSGGHTAKILARNHQYLGVNEAIKAYAARKLNDGKLGVFWHTQGSGKSYSMVFLAQKVRRKFEGSELNRLMKYADREDITGHTRKQYEAIAAIYAELQKKRKHINTTDLMIEINGIISTYVEIQHTPSIMREEPRRFDISAIDFDLLRREFAKVKKKNLVMHDLEEVIRQKLDRMLFTNPDRINYYERYQAIIEAYNSEQDRATIEKTFMDLMDLANQMNAEEQRYAREGFSSDEELSLYDMLFREDLNKNDIKKLKEVAADLFQKIKAKISELDHWTDKQETKAAIDNLIRDTLWAELPECYDELSISMYRQRIYEYVYTRYQSVA